MACGHVGHGDVHPVLGGGHVLVVGDRVPGVHDQGSTCAAVGQHRVECGRLRIAVRGHLPYRGAGCIRVGRVADVVAAGSASGGDAVRIELQLEERLAEEAMRVCHGSADPERRPHGVDLHRPILRKDHGPRQILRRPGPIRQRVDLWLVMPGAAVRVPDELLRVVTDAE